MDKSEIEKAIGLTEEEARLAESLKGHKGYPLLERVLRVVFAETIEKANTDKVKSVCPKCGADEAMKEIENRLENIVVKPSSYPQPEG